MSWRRQGSVEEDKIRKEIADTLLDACSDCDRVNKIELNTGRNLRDQMTVEEAKELDRERKLLGMGVRRN